MLRRWVNSLNVIAITFFLSMVVGILPANATFLDATVWNNLGQQFFTQKHYPEALLAYNHALIIKPEYSLVLANRCGVLSQLGEYSQALESCDLALEINSQWGAQGSALGWDNRGDALFNLDRYHEALRSFDQALLLNPNYQNALRNRKIVLFQLEQLKQH